MGAMERIGVGMRIEHLSVIIKDGMDQGDQIWLLRDPIRDFDPCQPGVGSRAADIEIEESHPQPDASILSPLGNDFGQG